MRYTILPRMHLSRLPPSTRVLLTLFILSVDAGLWVGSLKYSHRAEFTPAGATRYWHGDPATAPGVASGGDPARGALLPGEEQLEGPPGEIRPIAARKSTRQLVDGVHPHLFTVPVLLFILLHLLLLTRLSERAKIAFHLHAFASFAATFGLPFLLASRGGGAVWFVVAAVNLLVSFAVVSAILLFETWFASRHGAGGEASDPTPRAS